MTEGTVVVDSRQLVALVRALEGRTQLLEMQRESHKEELAVVQSCLREVERERSLLAQDLGSNERDNRRLLEELGRADGQRADLAKLYVSVHRLHGSLRREEVVGAIEEVVAAVVGCEEMALFELRGTPPCLSLLRAVGIAVHEMGPISPRSGLLLQALTTGAIARREPGSADGDGMSVCIPLKVEGKVTAVLALFRLLPHKESLLDVDGDLFEMLSLHAGVALHAAALHEAASDEVGR